jgi:hypothetical protein
VVGVLYGVEVLQSLNTRPSSSCECCRTRCTSTPPCQERRNALQAHHTKCTAATSMRSCTLFWAAFHDVTERHPCLRREQMGRHEA